MRRDPGRSERNSPDRGT